MYITNRPEIAQIAESAGVDRIFVDLEYIGKSARQVGLDTVQSHHTIDDVVAIRAAIEKAELLVRVNPIHEATKEYSSSQDEINAVVRAGADIVMLPFFKTAAEVRTLLQSSVNCMPAERTQAFPSKSSIQRPAMRKLLPIIMWICMRTI